MKRAAAALLCALLIITFAAPPSALAKGKNTVYILSVENDGARMRREPNSASDNVEVSLRKGTKVFYLAKSGAWYKVRSEYGPTGWVYKGYLKYYGAVSLSSVYIASAKTTVYAKTSTGAKRIATLSKKQFVIVRAANKKWAYIYTLSGTNGYVKVTSLMSVQ
jgi:uncharacterized protein YgiM (DUF1202 family)